MPSNKKDSGDYVQHITSKETEEYPRQFTWQEGCWMVIVSLSYLLGYAIHISIIVEKFSQEDPPRNRGFYVLYFLLPHIAAGLKNMQYHHREASEEEGEDGAMGWFWTCLLFPISPIHRFLRAWQFGIAEKDDWEMGFRYVDEMVTMGVLRLFDVFLGDLPTLTLLVRDDVWSRSEDWSNMEQPIYDPANCGGLCEEVLSPNIDFWTIFRMIFILSKMAQGITFYLVVVKRLQHLQHPNRYSTHKSSSSRQGRLNFFATILLYLAHFFFIGSRVMGYSLISQGLGAWVYLIVGLRWLAHSCWHLISLLTSHGVTPARSVSSLTMGGVWLIALTNEEGGRQLGKLILYYGLAMVESLVCGFLWISTMKDSGDYFAFKGTWATFIVFMMGLFLHVSYYALCHPGPASVTKEGLQCCSPNRRSPDSDDDDDYDYDRDNTSI